MSSPRPRLGRFISDGARSVVAEQRRESDSEDSEESVGRLSSQRSQRTRYGARGSFRSKRVKTWKTRAQPHLETINAASEESGKYTYHATQYDVVLTDCCIDYEAEEESSSETSSAESSVDFTRGQDDGLSMLHRLIIANADGF